MARKILPKRSTHRDTTPKIIYLIGFLAYVFWGAWGYILFNFPPDNIRNRLFFLGALFAAFFFTFLFLFYEIGKITTGKAPSVVFYPAVRRAFFAAIFFALWAIMSLLGIASLINIGLFGLILLLTEVQISRG